jgi:hypothetical protein
MEIKMCVECGEKPVAIKKRGLCARCYQKIRRGQIKDVFLAPITKLQFAQHDANREMDFVKTFFTHKNWIHHPANFKFNGETYTPDFYDGERNVFIEVVGSHQAFHQNKYKYELMEKYYPKISFEIRKYTGNILERDKNGRYIWDEKESLTQ